MDPSGLVQCLRSSLACGGLDTVTPLALGWYNSSLPVELGARIPARGAAGQAALAVLVGNSRALWEPFLQAVAADNLLQYDNPLEVYLDRQVSASLAVCASGLRHRIYWSHQRTPDLEGGGEHVAFQRMAHAAGLAFLDEDSHLCIHPRFGTWFSLRCCIIFDEIPYNQPKPAELANPVPQATRQYVRMALHTAVHNTSRKFQLPELDVEAAEAALAEAGIDPAVAAASVGAEEEDPPAAAAAGSGDRCMPAPAGRPGSSRSALSTLGSEGPSGSGGTTPAASSGRGSPQAGLETAAAGELASAVSSSLAGASTQAAAQHSAAAAGSAGPSRRSDSNSEADAKPCMRAVTSNWRCWVAVRDSPCPGHPWRYSEEQLRYHYTRDPSVLPTALLRRNLVGPGTPEVAPGGAASLLDPALQAFHRSAVQAQRREGAQQEPITAP